MYDPGVASIFGDTYKGVTNPIVPHWHPYPTRYHGPLFTLPQATFSYASRPRDVPVQNRSVMSSSFRGMGATPLLFSSPSGNSIVDAAIGGVIGYLVAPQSDKMTVAGVGVVAGLVAGTAGLIGAAGLGIWMRK